QTRVALFGYEMAASMLTVFGVMAVGLAAIGIYGLVSYTVKQCTHEIGIRLALGAQQVEVVRQFVRRGLWLGGLGMALGIALSVAASRLIASMLYGISPTDLVSFVGASLL